MKVIKVTVFIATFLFFSCANNQSGNKKTESELLSKKNADSIQTNIAVKPDKKFKDDDKYPKVLTYTEIFDQQASLNSQHKENNKYNSDTVSIKDRLNQYFHNYLTTQFKYMLSSELRILRNEFFARKGYIFKSKDLQEYFEEFRWYSAKTDDINKLELTKFEQEIIDTIKIYEERNRNLDEEYLKEQLRDYFKNNLQRDYNGKYYIDVPLTLFRRNIGYLIEKLSEHNKEYLNIEVIGRLKNTNLILGIFNQIDCPAEYCVYAGEIISCDSSFNYIDSYSIIFNNNYEETGDDYGAILIFPLPYDSDDSTIIRIQNGGQIIKL